MSSKSSQKFGFNLVFQFRPMLNLRLLRDFPNCSFVNSLLQWVPHKSFMRKNICNTVDFLLTVTANQSSLVLNVLWIPWDFISPSSDSSAIRGFIVHNDLTVNNWKYSTVVAGSGQLKVFLQLLINNKLITNYLAK